ncbi:MAG: HEAT repeat domain-containing protein [Pirellulales bacterium]
MYTRILSALILPLVAISAALAHDGDVDKLIKQLSAGGEAALAASDELAKHTDEADHAVPALIKALSSKDAELRWHAARALSDFEANAAPAAAALTKALADDNLKVRAYSAHALGQMGDAGLKAVPELVKLFGSKDVLVRRAAIRAIDNLDTDQSVTLPLLVKVLEDAEPSVIIPVLHELAEAGKDSLPRLITALDNEKACYWACLVVAEMGPEAAPAVPALIKALGHAEPDTRLQVLIALGEIGPAASAASDAVSKLLTSDDSAAVHYGAAFALGSMGDKSATGALEKAASSDDPFLKMISTWAIAMLNKDDKMAVRKAVKVLVGNLKHKKPNVRAAAARCLVRLEAPQKLVAPMMIEAFRDGDPTVTANMRAAIVSYGAKSVPRVVIALEQEEIRLHALDILRQLGSVANEAVPALTKLLSDDDAEVQGAVLKALAAIGPDSASATDAIATLLANDSEAIQQDALFALGSIGEGASGSAKSILPLLKSKTEFTKVAAGWALAQVASSNADIAKAAVPALIAGLSDNNDLVRAEAAAALGLFGKHAGSATDALKVAAKDGNADVRSAARKALKAIK